MKDFEKALRDLPRPDVPAEEFKRSLRAELNRSIRQRATSGYRRRFSIAMAAVAVLAAVLGAFVLQPQIPLRLHAAFGGNAETSLALPLPLAESMPIPQTLEAVFRQNHATADADRTSVENWYRRQALPVGVGKLEDEQIFAVRQFQLTNGERIIVFTELGEQPAQPSLSF